MLKIRNYLLSGHGKILIFRIVGVTLETISSRHIHRGRWRSNDIYDTMSRTRFSPDSINSLSDTEIFVFGSNLAGAHAAGASNVAWRYFGAEWGVGEGFRGRSYAIPTFDLPIEKIADYVNNFIKFADERRNLVFLVCPLGTGAAGFDVADIAPLFEKALDMDNVLLPERFVEVLLKQNKLFADYDPQPAAEAYKNLVAGISGARQQMRQIRAKIYRDTLRTVFRGWYVAGQNPDTVRVQLPDYRPMMKATRMYGHPGLSALAVPPRALTTNFQVLNADSFDIAGSLAREGYLPAVLNFANAFMPGGGVVGGAGAQEENLFRRSTLALSLYQFVSKTKLPDWLRQETDIDLLPESEKYTYPLHMPYGVVYTPGVTVFRENEASGYRLMKQPFRTAVITAAAIDTPQLVDGHMTDVDESITRNTIRYVLRAALVHGHDAIVLGAFGCGAFNNPPDQIAELFRQVLFTEEEFVNKFRIVSFAILDRGCESNYETFARIFNV